MKTMLCVVELFNGKITMNEEFDVEVIGKHPEEDYEAVDEIILDALENEGWDREDLENYEISFSLERI